MSLYDEVLSCPDTHCRKKALDKLCKEKIAEGMERAAQIADSLFMEYLAQEIRQAAEDLEKADEKLVR